MLIGPASCALASISAGNTAAGVSVSEGDTSGMSGGRGSFGLSGNEMAPPILLFTSVSQVKFFAAHPGRVVAAKNPNPVATH